jgi:hypothetical protein
MRPALRDQPDSCPAQRINLANRIGAVGDQGCIRLLNFRDITSGNNGSPCLVGYDLVTGRGSWTGATP